jgi:hypothetical protein
MQNEARTRRVRFLGNTDDVTTCECCGKPELKSTVVLSFDDGEPVHFGVVCAALAIGTDAKAVRFESRQADRAKAARENAARQNQHEAAIAPWLAFLAANGCGMDTFSRIQSLGGYAAARAAFLVATT